MFVLEIFFTQVNILFIFYFQLILFKSLCFSHRCSCSFLHMQTLQLSLLTAEEGSMVFVLIHVSQYFSKHSFQREANIKVNSKHVLHLGFPSALVPAQPVAAPLLQNWWKQSNGRGAVMSLFSCPTRGRAN